MKVLTDLKDYLCQRDPKWSDVKIGNSNLTIGRMGCTLTSVCMAVNAFGFKIRPDEIAAHKDWFTEDGRIIWPKLRFPNISFRWDEGNPSGDPNIDFKLVDFCLKHPDKAVLFEVDRLHWVLGLWRTYDGDILAADPWYGETKEIFKTYRQITSAVIFVAWNDKTKQAWQGKGKPLAPKYN